MPSIKFSQTLRPAIIGLSLALTCIGSWAARDFTPQAGTWVISEEVNGEPGRGLAIDVQGNTFFMQVFGYEPNGDATFYTAVGQMQGDTVTAPLVRYQGGRSFGSGPRDATEDRSLGDVTLHFRNGLQGTVQLPGEPEREIERFVFAGRDDPYFNTERWQSSTREGHWVSLNEQGQVLQAWRAILQWRSADTMQLQINDGSNWSTLACSLPAQSQSIRCVAEDDAASPTVNEAVFRLVGAQVTGSITSKAQGATPLRLQGVNTMSYECCGVSITGLTVYNGIEAYAGYESFINYGPNNTSLPSNGTWIMHDELTGKPGRGVSLDVQGGKLVMQVFGYQANGQPTFHMGVGTYASDTENSGTSGTRFGLQQYAGGRSIGGDPANAHWVQDAGDVVVSVSGAQDSSLAQAMVQFPGEEAKLMTRFALEPQQSLEDQFFGEWYFPAIANGGGPLTVTLNRLDGHVATNEEGSVHCQFDAAAQQNVCRWNHPRSALQYWAKLDDAFSISHSSLRVRDRHGNLTGLGDAPLD